MIIDVLMEIIQFYMPLIYLGTAGFILLCVGVSWLIVGLFTARIGSPKLS
jgi:hypothetical protein